MVKALLLKYVVTEKKEIIIYESAQIFVISM